MNAADHGTFTSSRYRRVEPIGAGAYGTVYKAIDCHTQQHVALKKIKIESEEEGIPSTAVREMCILRHLSHDNIVQLKDVIMDESQVILVFELEDTDLKKYLDRTTELMPLELVQSYSAQIICGLKYLHSMGVMHRDLKPQNILLTKEGVLKLADFGLSRAFTAYVRPLTAEHVITIWYRAPEVLLGATCYNASVDMWSAACVIAEMSSKKPLFSGSGEFDQLIKIFMQLGTPQVENWPDIVNLPYWRNSFPDFFPYRWSHILPNLDEEGRDLISKILVFDPNGRLPAREALNHPFVRQYVVRTPMNLGSPREDRFGTPTSFDPASSSPRASLGIGRSVHVETRENNSAMLSSSSSEAAVAAIVAASSSSSSSSSSSTSSSASSSVFIPPSNRTIKRSNSMPNPTIVNPNDGSISHLNVNHLVNGNTNNPTNIPKIPSHFQSKLVNQTSVELSNESHNIAGGSSISHTSSKVLISTNKSSFSALPKIVSAVQSSLVSKSVPKASGNTSSIHNSKENIRSAKIDAKQIRPNHENLEQLDNSMIGLDESIEIDSSTDQYNQNSNSNSNSSDTQCGDSDLVDNSDSNHSSHLIPTNSQRSTEDAKEDYINANISAALNRKQQVLNGGDRKFSRTRKPLQIVSAIAATATIAATTCAKSSEKPAISATTALPSSSAKTYRVTESSPETVTSDNTSSASLLTSSSGTLDKSDGEMSSNVLFADDRISAKKGLTTGGVITSNINSNSNSNINSNSGSKSNGGKKSSPSAESSKRKFHEPLDENSSQKKYAGSSESTCSKSDSSSSNTTIDPNKVYNESNFMKEAKHMAQLTEGVGRLTRRQSTFAGIK